MHGMTVTRAVHFATSGGGHRRMRSGPMPEPKVEDRERVPRVARLIALAIRIDGLIASGAIRDQAEAAHVGHVTRARMTQILNLLHLAPDIQLAVMNLPPTTHGRDPIVERHLRPIAAEVDWRRQREMWTTCLGGDEADQLG